MAAAEGFEGVRDFLSAGEWAAFHGRPASGITGLQHALEDRSAERLDIAKARWLLGVCQGATGRYGDAIATLAPLAAAPPRGDRWASFAASTTASMHRQLGRYAVARQFDTSALTAAEALPPQDVEPVADACLGLAADAVGEGDLPAALGAWRSAARIVDGPNVPWRPRVRAAWVSCEIALLEDDARTALQDAERAIELTEEARAPRHHAKSLLFRGVALRGTGDLAAAAAALRTALAQAIELGVPPLVWPAGTVLAATVAQDPAAALYPDEGRRAMAAARRAVAEIASGLPDDLASAWLERPEVPDPYSDAEPYETSPHQG